MTVKIPFKLVKALSARAKDKQISLQELVREALFWYLQLEEATVDELNAGKKFAMRP